MKKYDLSFDVDPLFYKMSKIFDEGGAKGMLMNNLVRNYIPTWISSPANNLCILCSLYMLVAISYLIQLIVNIITRKFLMRRIPP